MKVKEKKELHIKSVTELKKMLKDVQSSLLQLSLDKEQNRLKNTRSLFMARKDIAALKTVLHMKEGGEKIKDQK
jgi:ribosomal protein L29